MEGPVWGKISSLINKPRSLGLRYCDDPKAFIEYSNDKDDIFENIDEYNPTKKQNIDCVWWCNCWYA